MASSQHTPATAAPYDDTEPLEADDGYADSAYGDSHSLNSDTTSIASSMYAGYIENGRRYQTKREGEYWGPSDEKQFESMQAAHLLCIILNSQSPNPLFNSPIPKNAQNILDIGTGNGAWAIAVADQYPSALVQGVDLYPPPETWVPPNCTFLVDDVLKPWLFTQAGTFDLIHLRLLISAFTEKQWRGVYKQAFENLSPGGWIEQLEPNVHFTSDDGSLPADSALGSWMKVIGGAFEATGKPCDTGIHMRDRMAAAGFVNFKERTYKCPVGGWAKNPILREAGKFNRLQMKEGMEGYALFILTKFGLPEPWSPEQVKVYLDKIEDEMNTPSVHAYNSYKRVWAQKPLDA